MANLLRSTELSGELLGHNCRACGHPPSGFRDGEDEEDEEAVAGEAVGAAGDSWVGLGLACAASLALGVAISRR